MFLALAAAVAYTAYKSDEDEPKVNGKQLSQKQKSAILNDINDKVVDFRFKNQDDCKEVKRYSTKKDASGKWTVQETREYSACEIVNHESFEQLQIRLLDKKGFGNNVDECKDKWPGFKQWCQSSNIPDGVDCSNAAWGSQTLCSGKQWFSSLTTAYQYIIMFGILVGGFIIIQYFEEIVEAITDAVI